MTGKGKETVVFEDGKIAKGLSKPELKIIKLIQKFFKK